MGACFASEAFLLVPLLQARSRVPLTVRCIWVLHGAGMVAKAVCAWWCCLWLRVCACFASSFRLVPPPQTRSRVPVPSASAVHT